MDLHRCPKNADKKIVFCFFLFEKIVREWARISMRVVGLREQFGGGAMALRLGQGGEKHVFDRF